MGYDCSMFLKVFIKPEKREEFAQILKDYREEQFFERDYQFIEGLHVNMETGELTDLNENEQHDYSAKFALWLAPFVEDGDVDFSGSDGNLWGFHFDGNGKAYWVDWVRTVSTEEVDPMEVN